MLKKEWRKIIKELEKIVTERKDFITTESFYPRELASELINIEIHLNRAVDYIERPEELEVELDIDKYKELILKEKMKVKNYLRVKKKVEKILPDIHEYGESLKGKEELDFMLMKQKLYLDLHNGRLAEVEEVLSDLRKIIYKK